jgi:hypothetical protein
MNKYFILIFLGIITFQSADAQWFYNQFGVRSPDEMSKSQLESGLKYLLDKRQKTVIVYSVAIPVTATAGALLIHKANKSDSGEGSGMASALGATLLVVTVAGLVPSAVVQITTQSIRISKVRKALGNPSIHPEFSLCPKPGFGQTQTVPVCGIRVSFNF